MLKNSAVVAVKNYKKEMESCNNPTWIIAEEISCCDQALLELEEADNNTAMVVQIMDKYLPSLEW